MSARRDWPFLIGLAALFLFIIAIQVRLTYDSLEAQIDVTGRARLPFHIAQPEGNIDQVQNEAAAAGLRSGDVPVSLDGRQIHGSGDLVTAINAHRPGDEVATIVTRTSQRLSTVIRLAPVSATTYSYAGWVLPAFLDYLTPWICIVLGFFVAFLRPRDVLAWLLLLLMLSFKEIAVTDDMRLVPLGWTGVMRTAAVFSASLFVNSWPIAMLLFGQYFPDRNANRLWDRALRWVLAGPLTIIALLSAAISAGL